ncbi:hypothetical protein QTP88_019831 [Uroleucon formosanum]
MDRCIIQSLPKTKRVRLQTDENVDDPITGTDISPTSSTENVPQNCSKFQYLFDEFYKLLSTNGDKKMASCVTCHKKICVSTKSSGNLLSHIKVKDLVFEYIVNEMRPLRTCEKESFKSLIVGLTRSNDAIVPSRKELSKQLDLKYEQYVSMLTDLIAKQDYICATADIWSVNNRSYMGMTCHFIDEETYFRQSYVIGCIRIKGNHNYQNITEVITEIAKTYKIDLSKITHVVTDNASNFGKAFRTFSSLPTHEATNDISKMSNNDYNKISKSTFSKLSNFWNLARSTAVSDTIYEVCKCRFPVSVLVSGKILLFVEEYFNVMKPLAFSLDKLQGEKNSFLGYVAPTFLALRKLLIQSNQLTYCKPLSLAIVTSLEKRFSFLYNLSESKSKFYNSINKSSKVQNGLDDSDNMSDKEFYSNICDQNSNHDSPNEEINVQIIFFYLSTTLELVEIKLSIWRRYEFGGKDQEVGSVVQKDGGFGMDVKHSIKCGWMKWREASIVLCDKRFSTKLKGKFYWSVARPTMVYGSECWAAGRRIEWQSMSGTEMRMLRWMSGVTREDRIKNEYVRGSIGVASIVDKMRENRLRWLGHVMKREKTSAVIIVMKMNIEGKKGRGRPKKRWLKNIKKDMRAVVVCIEDVKDRDKWRFRTRVADSKELGGRRG